MIESKKISKYYNYLLSILIVLQVFYIVILNYTKSYGFLDFDSSLSIRHAIEIWKNGLFIDNWNYFSTTEIDCVSFFAAPLYMLTNNLNLAIGSMHFIFILIFILVIRNLFKDLELSNIYSKIFMAFLFTIYSIGQLDYGNMLFISSGQYEFRILAMLLLINCIIRKENNTKKEYFLRSFSILLNGWISLSSGNYLLLMVLFPILIAYFFCSIIDKKSLSKSKVIFLLLNVVVCIFCWKIKNYSGAESFRNNIFLIPAGRFFDNIFNCITGIFMLFGGLTLYDNISILSINGITQMLKFMVPIICIFISIKGVLISRKLFLSDKKVLFYAISIILVNFSILCLTNTTYGSAVFEYRYHLISGIMLFLCTAVSLEIWTKKIDNKAISLTIFTGIILLLFAVNTTVFISYKNYGSYDLPFEKEIVKYAREYDVDRIYVMENQTSAYRANALDYNRIYSFTTYDDKTQKFTIDTSNFYQKYQDSLQSTDTALLVCNLNLYESLPAYIKKSFEIIGTYMNNNIYISNNPKIDGFSGLNVANEISYDYPFSPNYICENGEINEEGILVTNAQEGFVLWGSYFNINSDINCDIILEYEVVQLGNDGAYFDIYIDKKQQMRAIGLDPQVNQVKLEDISLKKGNISELRIWQSEGSILKIKKFILIPK